MPRTKTKMGDRAFQVAGPHTWNNLPETIRETKTSGVARGSGARGQGILTAPPEKSLKFFPSVTKKLVLIPQDF